MDAVWGFTTGQFLLVYACLVLVATGFRVAMPGGKHESAGFDVPNLLFLVIVLVCLVRLTTEYFFGGSQAQAPLLIALVLSGFCWLLAYSGRHRMVRRKRFWLAWLVSLVATPIFGARIIITVDTSPTATFVAIVFSNALLFLSMVSSLPEARGVGGGGDGG